MKKVTLVDRNEFNSDTWAKLIKLGQVERVTKVKRAEDLLIPILDTNEPLLLDVTNLQAVIHQLQENYTWRLIERAILSSSGALITNTQYEHLTPSMPIDIPYLILGDDPDTTFWFKTLDEQRSKPNDGPGVGNWQPERVILIVGERPGNEAPCTKKDYAFLSSKGSSAWLCKQLEHAGFPEKHIYWINAYDRNDVRTDPSFVDILKPWSIYALGAYASKWCSESAFMNHHGFNHPQYWKRFRSSERYPLIETIEQNDYHRLDFPRSNPVSIEL
jgi:hypothetical protein